MTNYDKVKSKIQELVPELRELSFGCEVRIDNERFAAVKMAQYSNNILTILRETTGKNQWCVQTYGGYDYLNFTDIDRYCTILGHPIRLSHVLRAIEKKGVRFLVLESGEMRPWYKHESASDEMGFWLEKEVFYNLTDDRLSAQSEETISFLANVLGV